MTQTRPDTPQSTVTREEGVALARLAPQGHRADVQMPGGHTLIVDHPTEVGGSDCGPQPIDLMVASLAACKAITIRTQAQKHRWPLTGANVTARHQRVSARSLGEGKTGIIDLIDCEIEIQGDELTDQQRQRLYQLSASCWVQHALETQTRITSRLLDRQESPPD